MATIIGTNTFKIPIWFAEGEGIDLVQNGNSQVMEIHSQGGERLASIAELRAYDSDTVSDGNLINIATWHAGGTKGGGVFRYFAGNSDADDGGFTIVDALSRRWKRINETVVDPFMFGAKGDLVTVGVAATNDTTAFNNALAYCSATGIDFYSYGDHSFLTRIVAYPTKNFAMHMYGRYDWPAGCVTAGLYIEPTASGGWPSIYSNGGFNFTSGDPASADHTLLDYDNKNNINAARKDGPAYNYSGGDAPVIIQGITGKGSGLVTATGWNNGIVTNCRVATIRDCFIIGQRGTPDVNSIPQSTTALSWRGIAQIGRDYDARVITAVSVDPTSGEVTMTWSTGTAFDPPLPKKAYVFFDGFAGDFGKAFNWTMCQVTDVDTGAKTFKLANVNGLKLPPYTSGGTFEGSPQGVTCRVQHNKLRWFDKMIHLGQMEGYYVEDNRCIGGSTGLEVNEQIDLTLAGYNHFNSTWRGIYAHGVAGINATSPGLIFGRNPPIFLAGITITKGATTTGTWTAGTEMPWQMQNGTWVSFITTMSPNNVANISRANPAVLTYTGNDVFSNGNTVQVTNLPQEWQDELGVTEIETTISSVNTTTNTFQLDGIDTSGLSADYLDVIDIKIDDDGDEYYDYATVEGGMIQLDSYYKLSDIVRTPGSLAFTIKNATTGADINSSGYNSWVEGRMLIVAEPFTLVACNDQKVSEWTFKGIRDTMLRGIQIIDSPNPTGGYIHGNSFKNGTNAAVELHGNTRYINMGESQNHSGGTTNQFWDNSTNAAPYNFLAHRRNVMSMATTGGETAAAADGMQRALTPPVKSILLNYAGVLAINELTDFEDGLVQGIMNGTDPQSASAGLVILCPFEGTNAELMLADRMPRFLLPGQHADFVYDEDNTQHRELQAVSWRSAFEFFDDMWTANGVRQQTSGTSAAIATSTWQQGDATTRPRGTVSLATGTDTNGSASIGLMDGSFRLDQGASLSLIRPSIEVLSDGTNTYKLRLGWHDSVAGTAAVTDGVWWEYSSADSAFWLMKTAAAGVSTSTASTFTAAIEGYPTFGIFINGNGTRADFFHYSDPDTIVIDGTITTNIPLSANRCGWGVSLHKTAGTSSRMIHVDFMAFTYLNSRGHS